MRENCLQEFEAYWKCLDVNNMVSLRALYLIFRYLNTVKRSAGNVVARQSVHSINACLTSL